MFRGTRQQRKQRAAARVRTTSAGLGSSLSGVLVSSLSISLLTLKLGLR